MDGQRLDTEALVSPDIEETMIGSEWMQAHRCLWDFHGSQLYIDGKPAVMLSQRRKLRCRRLYADQDTVVPARQQIEVPARTTLLSARAPADTAIVETRQVQPGVYLGQTLLPPEHRNLRINVVNTTTAPRTVTAGEWLGNLQQVEVLADRHGKAPATELNTGAYVLQTAVGKDGKNQEYAETCSAKHRRRPIRNGSAGVGLVPTGRESSTGCSGARPARTTCSSHPEDFVRVADLSSDLLPACVYEAARHSVPRNAG